MKNKLSATAQVVKLLQAKPPIKVEDQAFGEYQEEKGHFHRHKKG